ncbi:nicotinate-nucleotide pyrophosphorylase [Spathaspora passalidarum NRRL Y-27907]|uniref:Nicotinate-nucleotide pyrophosphorylase [carboxylating] n=1 Tax=Spathaspora passalidarum (strain NRRL Y-27907 / 11-Y1) TaxID=619300 RepID=G3AG41_SPAPN|nr:nicotinate-nucleotide pyrophosphorylase [Spathaspora passalidarum NRRL Y-27907]EGW35181.1 nicotinate-nucleotide pyrophosphorylase [Spathaspora passalidarum NRRL Y-27907]
MSHYANLLPVSGKWKSDITDYLSEDVPSFDFGGFVVGDKPETGSLYMKAPGLICGIPFAAEVFHQTQLKVTWHHHEGEYVTKEQLAQAGGKIVVATVEGAASNILLAERTALNLLARASGVATQSYITKKLADESGYTGIIAGTRKTTPGLRQVEKYAMLVGGVDTHRYDLSSMVMLKDNHITSTGSITNAVAKARSVCGFAVKVEVEVSSEQDAKEAIDAGADVIMLDNFTGDELRKVAQSLKTHYKGTQTKFLLECSGGLTLQNLSNYLCNDIDIYSTSSIHQGTGIIDFSLKINASS